MLFYNDLDLNNRKILCLPSIFQFERKLGFWTTLQCIVDARYYLVLEYSFVPITERTCSVYCQNWNCSSKLCLQQKFLYSIVFVLYTLFLLYSWCNEIERKTVFLISGSRNYYLGLKMQLWNCKRGGLKLWSYFFLLLAHFWSFLQLMVSLLQSTNDTVKLKKQQHFFLYKVGQGTIT